MEKLLALASLGESLDGRYLGPREPGQRLFHSVFCWAMDCRIGYRRDGLQHPDHVERQGHVEIDGPSTFGFLDTGRAACLLDLVQ